MDYDQNFYAHNIRKTGTSPEIIFSVLFKYFDINSLCDVGGSVGIWTNTFLQMKGITEDQDADVMFIDGDYVKDDMFVAPKKYFRPFNLEERIDLGGKRFDLAMSLEVAEHLSPKRAESFVEDLTKLSDVIMFSAAVEGQGGTHHVNEQYMPYWVEKFEKFGYAPFDLIRPEIQFCMDVPWYYRQNIIVLVNKESKFYTMLRDEYHAYPPLMRMVAIECFEGKFKLMKRLRSSRLLKLYSKITGKK